jgi:hypothetical protein
VSKLKEIKTTTTAVPSWSEGLGQKRRMSSSFYILKKQKTGTSSFSSCCSGGSNSSHDLCSQESCLENKAGVLVKHHSLLNGYTKKQLSVAHPEMCYFCFDVIYSHLHQKPDTLKLTKWTSDE